MSSPLVKIENIDSSCMTKKFVVKGRIKPIPKIIINLKGNGKHLIAILYDNTASIGLVAFNDDCDKIFPQLKALGLISLENIEVHEVTRQKTTNHQFNLVLKSTTIIKNFNNVGRCFKDYPKLPLFSKDLTTLSPGTIVDVLGEFSEIGDLNKIGTFRFGKFKTGSLEISVKFYGEKADHIYHVRRTTIIYSAKLSFYQGNNYLDVTNISHIEYTPNLYELKLQSQFSHVARDPRTETEVIVHPAISSNAKNIIKGTMKRIHPTKLQSATNNEGVPDNQLSLTPKNISGLSTTVNSSGLSSQSQTTTQCSSSPTKRPRQSNQSSKKISELTGNEKKTIDKSLIKMIVADYQSLSLVENVGFLEYSKKLQPFYSVPSIKQLTELLFEEYNIICHKIKSILENISDLSITTDVWTSDCNKSYITVTSHFILDDRLYSPVLATREILDNHNGQNIATVLTHIFNDWGIAKKIVTVVSDNGPNFKNAINDRLKKYYNPCVAHTLNLTLNEAINGHADVQLVLNKCRTIVGHIKHSDDSTGKLKDLQVNSSLIMIERLQNIKGPQSATMSSIPRAPECLTTLEWEILQDCINILKPFESMMAALSEENYPTLSKVLPLVKSLLHFLRKKSDTQVGDAFRNTLLDLIRRRLGHLETNKIAAKATFLDPRFKDNAFAIPENANNVQAWIREELNTNIYMNIEKDNEINVTESTSSTNNTTNSLWELFDSQNKVKLIQNENFSQMIRQYLEMPPLDRKKNPLEFWQQNKHRFPDLYKIQHKYLCVPATSVPSERIFSKTVQIANDRRNKLDPKNLDLILFINSNLHLF